MRASGWFRRLDAVADMVVLARRCAATLVTPPFTWRVEFLAQCVFIVRRCALPIALSTAFLSFGTNLITLAEVAKVLGASDRIGGITPLTALREYGIWTTGMIVAGIAGTAMCADLGARKVREELDALEVLSVEVHRSLVFPRVLAITVMSPLMYLWAVFFVIVVPWLLGPSMVGFTRTSFAVTFGNVLTADVYAGLIKATLIGMVVGVVSCAKGLRATGGPSGVGRSVNEAVVISFVATWAINLLFNAFYQAAFPITQTLR